MIHMPGSPNFLSSFVCDGKAAQSTDKNSSAQSGSSYFSSLRGLLGNAIYSGTDLALRAVSKAVVAGVNYMNKEELEGSSWKNFASPDEYCAFQDLSRIVKNFNANLKIGHCYPVSDEVKTLVEKYGEEAMLWALDHLRADHKEHFSPDCENTCIRFILDEIKAGNIKP